MNRRIDIYVDLKFLENYFNSLNHAETLSEEFEVLYSFLKIIKQPHIRIINLESGTSLRYDDIVRVFQSTFKLHHEKPKQYVCKYSEIKNPQSLFFGEHFESEGDSLRNKFGFIFAPFRSFKAYWKKLLLINIRRTIHIQAEEDAERSALFWHSFLTDHQLPANNIVFVEPYLNTWFKQGNEDRVRYNFIEIIKTLLYCERKEVLVITNSGEIEKPSSRSSKEDSKNKLVNHALVNIPKLSGLLKDLNVDHRIYSFHKKTLRDKLQKEKDADKHSHKPSPYDQLNNVLHDRYIVTNYFLIISTHSLDMVNEGKNIVKNTQLIIEPLLSHDFFQFYTSKMSSYRNLMKWEDNPNLKAYVLVKPQEKLENPHVDYVELKC